MRLSLCPLTVLLLNYVALQSVGLKGDAMLQSRDSEVYLLVDFYFTDTENQFSLLSSATIIVMQD